MKLKINSFLILLLIITASCDNAITTDKLLDNAIAYHDPEGQWEHFNGQLIITMTIPDQPDRLSEININLPEERFYVKATRDTLITEYDVQKNDCKVTFNGRTTFSEAEITEHRLNCETAKRYQNYYTYLYGLPMKLKDPGTHIDQTFEHKNFKGKDYLVLKVTYDEAVGSDFWYFYFDPETYAMEIYQFFRMDENGIQKNDTGEYILLTEEKIINSIKMPKIRAWYYNKDDTYLGTDTLN